MFRELNPGDPGSLATPDDPLPGFDTTDSDGEGFSTYTAPTNQLLAGQSATVRALIGDGDEVGDPQPGIATALLEGFASVTLGASGNLVSPVGPLLDEFSATTFVGF